jgi:sn-glycerol 3-phosphate transport system substrate-binding protein
LRVPATLVVLALVAGACGNGRSILEIGGATVPTEPPRGTGGEPTTIPTTTAVPVAELPPCPVDALASASSPVPITFWHAMTSSNVQALTKLTDAYNASQSKVKVSLIAQGGYEQLIDKYKNTSPADRPNLVQMPEYTVELLADSDTIVPVQSCVSTEGYSLDDFLPRAVAYYTLRSALQGMPFNVSNPVLYFNKSVFVKAGLDPEHPPLSLEELRSAAEKIVSSGAARYGIAFDHSIDGGGGWFLEQWMAKADELYSNNENGRAAPSTRVLYAGQTGVDLLTFVQKLVQDGLAIDVGALTSLPDNLLKMVDPKEPAGMTIYSSAGIGPVIQLLSGGSYAGFKATDLGIGSMPGPTVNPGTLVGGAALWLPTGKSDVETAAAWDFLKYLVAPEQQSAWAAATGYVPVRVSAVDLPPIKDVYAVDPRFKVAYDQLNAAADTPVEAGPVLGPQREIRNLTSRAVEAILTQNADVASTLEGAARQSDLLLAQWATSQGGS